jgi:hypothetical protein
MSFVPNDTSIDWQAEEDWQDEDELAVLSRNNELFMRYNSGKAVELVTTTNTAETTQGDKISRVVEYRLVSMGTRKVACYLVQPDQGSSQGAWHRYSDFEQLAAFVLADELNFPLACAAWYQIKATTRPWRCIRDDYLQRKAELLSAFIEELSEDIKNGDTAGHQNGKAKRAFLRFKTHSNNELTRK